jgi:hypothetical protein
VHRAGLLARYTGRAWWAADGARSACGRVERAAVRQCGSAAPPAERDYPLAKGSNNTRVTHTHTHTMSRSSRKLMSEAAFIHRKGSPKTRRGHPFSSFRFSKLLPTWYLGSTSRRRDRDKYVKWPWRCGGSLRFALCASQLVARLRWICVCEPGRKGSTSTVPVPVSTGALRSNRRWICFCL